MRKYCLKPSLLIGISALLLSSLSACSDETVEQPAPEQRITPASELAEPPVIRLTPSQVEDLDIQTVTVTKGRAVFTLSLPGQVFPAPDRFAQVSAPIGGRVVQIYAHEGEHVNKNRTLLAIESLEFANLAAEYLQAVAEEAYQQIQVERLQTLVDKKIAPRSRLDRANADLNRSRAGVSASYARLKALGITDAELDGWNTESRERPLLKIYAPIAGTIDLHRIDIGQSVSAYQEMMTIVGSDKVLIRGFVSPEDAATVKPGDPVTITVKASPERALVSTIATVNPSVDQDNRSVAVNILAMTNERWPMPGQSVRLEIQASNAMPVISIPLSAVQFEGQQPTVFVRRDSLTYEKRQIVIDRMDAETVVVASGLASEEEVAVTDVFSLKALGRYALYAE
ncbi:MAG: efflux RND transporter periplasmic adaptor subunit [Rhodothermales bacterium]|nr:efflux RND transporter periplasmic adaptor subunit [Rhodothermales bacterium]